MPRNKAQRTPNSHSPNSQYAGAQNQQDSGEFGPSTFYDAATHVRLHTHEANALCYAHLGATLPAARWQTQNPAYPQLQGPLNPGVHQTYSHLPGQDPQTLPQVLYQVVDNQGTRLVPYQYQAPHPQAFHPPQPQPQPQPQPLLQAPQPAPAAGGSRAHRSSEDGHSGWRRLCSERKRWNPNAREPLRGDGQSVLMDFSVREDNRTYCRVPTSNGFCDYSNVKKERFLHHIRKDHLNFLPFVCGGACRFQTCQQRFACETSRNEHIKPRMALCELCGKEMYNQNFRAHYTKCSQGRPC